MREWFAAALVIGIAAIAGAMYVGNWGMAVFLTALYVITALLYRRGMREPE